MLKLSNNAGQEFLVLKEYSKKIKNRKWEMWTVQFTNTGYTREVYKQNALLGKVRDPYEISFCGVGFEGEFEKVSYWKQAKRLWCNMLKRCYSENYPTGYYGRGITVDSRWLCFSNFLYDLPELENFDNWLEGFKEGCLKYNLDKDLIIEGNKVYSRECCSFVLDSVNKSAGAKNSRPFERIKRRNEVGKV